MKKTVKKLMTEREHEIHKRKLKEMKPTFTTCNKQYQFKHLHKKLKREQMLEDRYTEIERENRILLEKMTHIMHSKNGGLPSVQHPPNRVDSVVLPPKKSLNKEKRRKDLVKITMENHQILKRLQDRQPNYSLDKWELEHKEQEKRVKNLCEYPFILNTDRESKKVSSIQNAVQEARNYTPSVPNIKQKMGIANITPARMRSRLEPIASQILHENRTVLFKTGKQLANSYYIIEISTFKKKLYIAAFDTENPQSLLVEIPEGKARTLMAEFHNDYELLTRNLQIINRKLVVFNPNPQAREEPKKKREFASSGDLERTHKRIKSMDNYGRPITDHILSKDSEPTLPTNYSEEMLKEDKKKKGRITEEDSAFEGSELERRTNRITQRASKEEAAELHRNAHTLDELEKNGVTLSTDPNQFTFNADSEQDTIRKPPSTSERASHIKEEDELIPTAYIDNEQMDESPQNNQPLQKENEEETNSVKAEDEIASKKSKSMEDEKEPQQDNNDEELNQEENKSVKKENAIEEKDNKDEEKEIEIENEKENVKEEEVPEDETKGKPPAFPKKIPQSQQERRKKSPDSEKKKATSMIGNEDLEEMEKLSNHSFNEFVAERVTLQPKKEDKDEDVINAMNKNNTESQLIFSPENEQNQEEEDNRSEKNKEFQIIDQPNQNNEEETKRIQTEESTKRVPESEILSFVDKNEEPQNNQELNQDNLSEGSKAPNEDEEESSQIELENKKEKERKEALNELKDEIDALVDENAKERQKEMNEAFEEIKSKKDDEEEIEPIQNENEEEPEKNSTLVDIQEEKAHEQEIEQETIQPKKNEENPSQKSDSPNQIQEEEDEEDEEETKEIIKNKKDSSLKHTKEPQELESNPENKQPKLEEVTNDITLKQDSNLPNEFSQEEIEPSSIQKESPREINEEKSIINNEEVPAEEIREKQIETPKSNYSVKENNVIAEKEVEKSLHSNVNEDVNSNLIISPKNQASEENEKQNESIDPQIMNSSLLNISEEKESPQKQLSEELAAERQEMKESENREKIENDEPQTEEKKE